MARPLKYQSVEELQNAIDNYFFSCEDPENPGLYKRPLTVTGLAVALDTTRDILLDYQEREEFSYAIKKAKQKIQNYAEEYLFSGRNATGAIFNLKNNWGWKDKTETDVTSDGKSLSIVLAESIANKHASLNQTEPDSEWYTPFPSRKRWTTLW